MQCVAFRLKMVRAECRFLYRLIFAIKRIHCECCTPRPWPKFSTLKIWNDNISGMVNAREKFAFFHRFWYFLLPSNGAITDVAPHHFDLHFQCQTFSCYAFAIKFVQSQLISPADLPPLARPPTVAFLLFHCVAVMYSYIIDSIVFPAIEVSSDNLYCRLN